MRHSGAIWSLAVLALTASALTMSGCSGQVSFTTASLSEATMCLGVDAESRPVNPTDKFATTTPALFCSVKLSNAPDDTEVAAKWVYVMGALPGVTNYVIDTVAVTSEGTRYIVFSVGIPDNGWPKGDYKLVLSVDGKEEVSLPFTVVEAPPLTPSTPPASPSVVPTLTAATLALGVDEERKPVDPTTEFTPDTPKIHCSVLLSNAIDGTEVLSEWYYVSGELQGVSNLLIDSAPIVVSAGTQYIDFSLSIPDAGWPIGDYKLVLYLDGVEKETLPFSVVSTAMRISEATMARDVDSQNRPVNPTSAFSPGAPGIYCSVYMANMTEGAVMRFEWYYLHGTGMALTNHLYSWHEVPSSGGSSYQWFRLNPPTSGFFPVGEYLFVLYVDQVEQVRLPFTVA